jgi:NifU-like protein
VRRVEELNKVLAGHAGGITLEDIGADGTVSLRYTGMCTGCQGRPVTKLTTIEPGLLDVPGVTAVDIPGARISVEAAERLRDAIENTTFVTTRRGSAP